MARWKEDLLLSIFIITFYFTFDFKLVFHSYKVNFIILLPNVYFLKFKRGREKVKWSSLDPFECPWQEVLNSQRGLSVLHVSLLVFQNGHDQWEDSGLGPGRSHCFWLTHEGGNSCQTFRLVWQFPPTSLILKLDFFISWPEDQSCFQRNTVVWCAGVQKT